MRRSESITLGSLLGVAALFLAGCAEDQRCIDSNMHVVADENCEKWDAEQGQQQKVQRPYRWYWGGGGRGIGERVSGGRFEPSPGLISNKPNAPRSSVHSGGAGESVRGGFGSKGGGAAFGGA